MTKRTISLVPTVQRNVPAILVTRTFRRYRRLFAVLFITNALDDYELIKLNFIDIKRRRREKARNGINEETAEYVTGSRIAR